MRRLGALLLLLLTACAPSLPAPAARPTFTPTPHLSQVQAVPPTDVTPPRPSPAPTLTVPEVLVFPEPPAGGDRLSLNIAPALRPTDTATVTVAFPGGTTWQAAVVSQGFDMRPRARGVWLWTVPTDTRSLAFTVTLSLPPEGGRPLTETWVETSPVLAAADLLPPEPAARWAVTETHELRLHYLTHSAAARDLSHIVAVADEAYHAVTTRFGEPDEPVDFYFLDRVLGQGGYATSQWVAVTYTDRNYAPTGLGIVLRHELTHRLDDAIGCRDAPSLLREGLAVYVAGGHYRLESLPRKAAALLQTGRYIPLAALGQDFYTHQHEIGYLEAGALISYVVDEFGDAGLERLCRASASADGDDLARLNAGAQALGWDWAALEQRYLAWLRAIHPPAAERAALQAEWHVMETMRAYQAAYDPGANFQLGIFFDPHAGEEAGIAADFVRRPRTADAITLELVLEMAQSALGHHRPAEAERLLAELDAALAQGIPKVGFVASVRQIVTATLARGYEPYRLTVSDDPVTGGTYFLVYALDRAAWPRKCLLTASQSDGAWIVTGPQP